MSEEWLEALVLLQARRNRLPSIETLIERHVLYAWQPQTDVYIVEMPFGTGPIVLLCFSILMYYYMCNKNISMTPVCFNIS